MRKHTRAAKLGRQFKKVQNAMLYIIPGYFVGRVLLTVIFDI
jgi:hypothetical protein